MASAVVKKGIWAAVIPAYNEEKTLGGVIASLKEAGFDIIIVVDDCSKDNTYAVAKTIAKKTGAKGLIVLRHVINRGLGGALGTGIAAALKTDADVIVTVDADGQHLASDAVRVAKTVENGSDFVIGSRLMDSRGMPFVRKVGNYGLNVTTYLLFGVWCTDTQSGLRGFSRNAASKIRIRTDRMEVSSEIIKEIGANNLKMTEIPIKPIYTDYSLQKGQSTWNGFRILAKLVWQKIVK